MYYIDDIDPLSLNNLKKYKFPLIYLNNNKIIDTIIKIFP